MITVKLSAEFQTEDGDQLTATREYTDWVADLPSSAELHPVTVDKGNQRDPWPVLVGMRATWEEQR
jgi:hypothetical protein